MILSESVDASSTLISCSIKQFNSKILLRTGKKEYKMSPISKFCSECGAPLEEGARFCGECGAAITDIQDSAESKETFTTPPPPPSQRYEEQSKKPKPKTKSAQHSPLKIIPLFYWSVVWGIGLACAWVSS